MLVPIPPLGPLSWFMLGLLWDLCNPVLEGKRLLPPIDVETDPKHVYNSKLSQAYNYDKL